MSKSEQSQRKRCAFEFEYEESWREKFHCSHEYQGYENDHNFCPLHRPHADRNLLNHVMFVEEQKEFVNRLVEQVGENDLDLRHGMFERLSLFGLEVQHDLLLSKSEILGDIYLRRAQIGGDAYIVETEIGGDANLIEARIEGNASLSMINCTASN